MVFRLVNQISYFSQAKAGQVQVKLDRHIRNIQDHCRKEQLSEMDFRCYPESETRFECVLLGSRLKQVP